MRFDMFDAMRQIENVFGNGSVMIMDYDTGEDLTGYVVRISVYSNGLINNQFVVRYSEIAEDNAELMNLRFKRCLMELDHAIQQDRRKDDD